MSIKFRLNLNEVTDQIFFKRKMSKLHNKHNINQIIKKILNLIPNSYAVKMIFIFSWIKCKANSPSIFVVQYFNSIFILEYNCRWLLITGKQAKQNEA